MIELTDNPNYKKILTSGSDTRGLPKATIEQAAEHMNKTSWMSKFVL